MTQQLIAGNWKMNGLGPFARDLATDLAKKVSEAQGLSCSWAIFPPFPLLAGVAAVLQGSEVLLGGQDCHFAESGAHTGDTSALLLKDVGCSYVIVGHSERRQNHGETSALVLAKATAAAQAGLVPIICVGETRDDRD
ncbi:MAG: triose-phosphate isomerase, partial [Kiloniellales bacterium]|nr:triose-phosphate isomerase [Kiloniellales bacterium]